MILTVFAMIHAIPGSTFELKKKEVFMVKGKAELKILSNVHIASRMRQLVALIIAIILGMLITGNAQAQEPRYKMYKSKKACMVLARKRSQSENLKVQARKVKYKPQAEMEAPAAYRTTARKEMNK